MPFKSEAQRRFMYARHPDIAKRWTAEAAAKNNAAIQPSKKHSTAKKKS